MSHTLVKIFKDDDGIKIENPVWHLSEPDSGQGGRALCTCEFYGGGESSVVFKTKTVEKGGINCVRCLEIINDIKAIKL